jgi:hypothetical protein
MQENGEIIRRHLDVTKNKWGYNSLNTIFNQGKWGYDMMFPMSGYHMCHKTLPNMVYFPMEPWSSGIPCWDDHCELKQNIKPSMSRTQDPFQMGFILGHGKG